MSFRTTEWFATLNTRATDRVEFVFHLGAKVRDAGVRPSIPDIAGCLQWKSADRCLVTFRGEPPVEDFARFVQAWIQHV